jgi:tetratricopeptide (TPR) repeat protein
LFFNKGADLNNQANDIPPQEVDAYNAMREKALEEFIKSTEYFERALEINPTDMYCMKQLKQIYFQLRGKPGYSEKIKEMDELIHKAEETEN